MINDFIIPSKDKETEKRHRGRHMQIEYSLDKQNYIVKDLGIGFGAFVRLDRPLELKDNHLLNMGESFIIVNLINERITSARSAEGYSLPNAGDDNYSEDRQGFKLRLKLFGGPSTGEVFYFTPNIEDQQNQDTPYTIRIGRSNQCDVVIEDAVLSKL